MTKKTERMPAREELARAILKRDQLAQYIAVAEEARMGAVTRWSKASRELESIEREERETTNVGHSIISALGRGDAAAVATIVRNDSSEARKRELQSDIETWFKAKEQIRATIDEYKRSLEFAEVGVKGCARAVIADGENVARLMDGLAELEAEVARRRRGLAFVASVSDPGERTQLSNYLIDSGDALTRINACDNAWSAALEALLHNADAPLPCER